MGSYRFREVEVDVGAVSFELFSQVLSWCAKNVVNLVDLVQLVRPRK